MKGDWLCGQWAWLSGQGRDMTGRRTKMETTASVWNLRKRERNESLKCGYEYVVREVEPAL